MVEIPEHLLQRSREARARLTGAAPAAEPDAAPAAAAPAPEPEPEPAPPASPPAAPVVAEEAPAASAGGALEPVVAGAALAVPVAATPKIYAPTSQPSGLNDGFRGSKVPGWILSTYVLVPLLAIALLFAVAQAHDEEQAAAGASSGPDGAALYSKNCAGCHGSEGLGGAGPALKNVVKVFPDPKDQLAWVQHVANETAGPYGAGGAGNEGKGAQSGAMPIFAKDKGGNLTDEEIFAIIAHERVKFGGQDKASLPKPEDIGVMAPK